MDAKKKELVGQFKNQGLEWQPQKQPVTVNVHDFPDPQLGFAIPYGIYDIGQNPRWVWVGQDHDTASFAVASLQCWWQLVGHLTYPRLFSHISMNWRGRPLIRHEVIVELIAVTTTAHGLTVQAELDTGVYPLKVKLSDAELATVQINPHPFHGEWNYTISSQQIKQQLVTFVS